MEKLIVGIDISKDTLDFCVLQESDHKIVERGTINNGKDSILSWLEKLDQKALFSMEHTGHYGALLVKILSEKKRIFYLLNPLELKSSIRHQRGKTDAIDAFRIASFTIANKYRLAPFHLPTEELRKLKVLITARERYVKMSVQIQNSLKANLILQETLDLKEIIREEKRQLKSIQKALESFEKQMKEVIKSSQELKKNYDKIIRIVGVGPITAIKCITETENFVKFSNGRKFSCHCGLAPFPYQSGSSVRGKTKTHHLRDKALKSIFFKAAGTAIQHDFQLKAYYKRKTKEGKPKLCALNAVANKLVLRIFAVVKRDEAFVKFAC